MGTHPIFESDFDCLTDWTKKCQQHQNKWFRCTGVKRPRPRLPTAEPGRDLSKSTENRSNKLSKKLFSSNSKNQPWSLEKSDLLVLISEFEYLVVVELLKFMLFARLLLVRSSHITKNMLMNSQNKKLRIC